MNEKRIELIELIELDAGASTRVERGFSLVRFKKIRIRPDSASLVGST